MAGFLQKIGSVRTRLESKLNFWLDSFLSEPIKSGDAETLSSARFLIKVALTLIFISLGLLSFYIETKGWANPNTLSIIFTEFCFLIVISLLFFTSSYKIAALFFVITTLFVLSSDALMNAGLASESTYWYPFLIILSGFLLGPTAAIVVTLTIALFLTIFLNLHFSGFTFPSIAFRAIDPKTIYATNITVTFLSLVISIAYENKRRRTEDLLKEEREIAMEATQAKSHFLATMSHEIRTPLSGVVGMSGMLLDSELSPEQKKMVMEIRHAEEGLLTLINDILDFSKIESGKIELEQQPFNLLRTLENSLYLFDIPAKEKGVTLKYVVDDFTPKILIGDALRLRQILVNLIGNALKFTEKGGDIIVTVSSTSRGDGTFNIQFAVKDTGTGIPKDKLEKIFYAYEQADPSIPRQYGGTGLGLPIAKSLVEAMGGKINLASEIGKGSIFYFNIIAKGGVLLDGEKESGEISKFDPNFAKRHPLRILIAEDNPISQKVGVYLLEKLGYFPDLASDGSETIELLEKVPYDIIFMDMKMPVLDGIETTKYIVANWPRGKRPRIIATTANVLLEDRRRCAQAGMDDFLIKPLQIEDLVRALKATPKITPLVFKPTPPRPSFDPTFLIQGVGDDLVMLREVVSDMLTHWPKFLTNIQKAIEAQDAKSLEHWAHSLKGNLGLINAESTRILAFELENMGKNQDFSGAHEKFKALLKDVESLKGELQHFLQTKLAA